MFRSQNHIDEIKGVYVPFWLYDSDADAQLRFTATRTRFWSDDDYDYTETSYYSVRRTACWALTRFRWTAPPRWQTT